VKCHSTYCRGAGTFNLRSRFVNDLDIEIGRAKPDLITLGLNQNVRKDWDGIAALDHRLRLTNGLQQSATFDRKFHVHAP
jgi:hypothetical protein